MNVVVVHLIEFCLDFPNLGIYSVELLLVHSAVLTHQLLVVFFHHLVSLVKTFYLFNNLLKLLSVVLLLWLLTVQNNFLRFGKNPRFFTPSQSGRALKSTLSYHDFLWFHGFQYSALSQLQHLITIKNLVFRASALSLFILLFLFQSNTLFWLFLQTYTVFTLFSLQVNFEVWLRISLLGFFFSMIFLKGNFLIFELIKARLDLPFLPCLRVRRILITPLSILLLMPRIILSILLSIMPAFFDLLIKLFSLLSYLCVLKHNIGVIW